MKLEQLQPEDTMELVFIKTMERTLNVSTDNLLQTVKHNASRGWTLVLMDDDTIAGLCESCGSPIVDGNVAWGPDDDGVILCHDCVNRDRGE
jgi:hypothetical protein